MQLGALLHTQLQPGPHSVWLPSCHHKPQCTLLTGCCSALTAPHQCRPPVLLKPQCACPTNTRLNARSCPCTHPRCLLALSFFQATLQPSWRSVRPWSRLSRSLSQHHAGASQRCHAAHQTTSCEAASLQLGSRWEGMMVEMEEVQEKGAAPSPGSTPAGGCYVCVPGW